MKMVNTVIKHSIASLVLSIVLSIVLCATSAAAEDGTLNTNDALDKQLDDLALRSKQMTPELSELSPEKIDCMLEPFSVVEVASSTSGVVKEVYVDRGSIVKEGEVIAELESGVEKANAQHAEAKLQFHEKKFERLKTLYEQSVIAFNEMEEAQTELELARHEYQRAEELLRMRTISSPFSGVVVEKYISPGELTDQQKVVKIAQLNPLKVEIIAPISIYGTVSQGMLANVWPEGPEPGPFDAEIDIVDKVVDAASGTFGISLLLPNPDYSIPAGVRCTAKVLPNSKSTMNLAAKVRTKKHSAKISKQKKSTKYTASAQVKVNQHSGSINGVAMAKAGMMNGMAANGVMLGSTEQQKQAPSWPTLAQLQDVVTQFISAYENGSLAQFDSLFSVNAKSNDHKNLAGIKEEYRDLFTSTSDRQMFINDLSWSFVENQAKGVGKLHALIVSKEDEVRVIKGKIQFVAEKAGNKVWITHLYHYDLHIN